MAIEIDADKRNAEWLRNLRKKRPVPTPPKPQPKPSK